MIFHSFRMYA
ncbi:Protein of unknown function [Thermobacillus xylanilyticus]|uniref:Uncharacterized protein n=1 Tax=Thermobacillus xylanilyticus TaxID=76633 RepID=A0ABN7RMV4_THEXY|nr:Protein of unknown function [Thermobacillus xylanilyticus]